MNHISLEQIKDIIVNHANNETGHILNNIHPKDIIKLLICKSCKRSINYRLTEVLLNKFLINGICNDCC
jgi:hypothetical protein